MRKQETKNVITELETYLESFSEFEKRAAGRNLPWLRSLREDAFARFCQVGFPTPHDEDWRFTNVSAIARTPFQLAQTIAVSSQDLETYRNQTATCRLVFVHGRLVPELSSVGKLPAGLQMYGLAKEINDNPGAME